MKSMEKTMLLLIFDTEEEKQLAIRIYEKYSKFMFKVAYDVLKSDHNTEDAVQQAFIKISKNFDKINELNENKTRNYIGLITRHTAVDMYNEIKGQPFFIGDDCADVNACDISEIIITKETYNRIKKHINSLKPHYKEIIYLKFGQDLTYNEIAKLLDITPENARKRLERARAQVLKLLEEEDGYGGK